ncbi:MAG TPA: glycosyltransferase, partial [Microthrixaceae bacterium]|nr:glycosyltransferase [Microthrixaceae bacterium]
NMGVGADRLDVIPLGYGSPRTAQPLAPAELRQRLGLGDGPIVLNVGQKKAHRNLEGLIDAFAIVRRDVPDAELVLPGPPNEQAEIALLKHAEARGLTGAVHIPGYVESDELEGLYKAAAAFVLPSLIEGFGLPVLEAMVRGVPVVAAAAGSLPEVARPEDLVPAEDVAAWAAAIEAVLAESTDARNARIAGGRERAAQFGPERTAAALLTAYRRAAAARVPT